MRVARESSRTGTTHALAVFAVFVTAAALCALAAGCAPAPADEARPSDARPSVEALRALVRAADPDQALAARRQLLAALCDNDDAAGAMHVLRDLGTYHPEALTPERYADAAHRIADRKLRRSRDADSLQRALAILLQGLDDFPDSQPLRELFQKVEHDWLRAHSWDFPERDADLTPYEYWILADP